MVINGGLGVSAPTQLKYEYPNRRWKVPLMYLALSFILTLVAITLASPCQQNLHSQGFLKTGEEKSFLDLSSTSSLPQTENKVKNKISSWIRLVKKGEEEVPTPQQTSWIFCMKTVLLDEKQFMNHIGQISFFPFTFCVFTLANLILSLALLIRCTIANLFTSDGQQEKEVDGLPIKQSSKIIKQEFEPACKDQHEKQHKQQQHPEMSLDSEKNNVVFHDETSKFSSPCRANSTPLVDEISPRSIISTIDKKTKEHNTQKNKNHKNQGDGPRKKQKTTDIDGLELPLLKSKERINNDDNIKKHAIHTTETVAKQSTKKRRLNSKKS